MHDVDRYAHNRRLVHSNQKMAMKQNYHSELNSCHFSPPAFQRTTLKVGTGLGTRLVLESTWYSANMYYSDKLTTITIKQACNTLCA